MRARAANLPGVFLGHFAVGFASKRAAPRASLGVLMAAPLFADLLWPIFLIAGVETVRIDPGTRRFTPLDLHDFPWSHSLVTSLAWSVVLAAAFWAATRYGRGALVIAMGVFSHFVWISCPSAGPAALSGQPDVGRPGPLELAPGDAGRRGRAVRRSASRSTPARRARINRRGAVAFWALVVFLAAFYAATFFGPPPPSVDLSSTAA